MSDKHQKLYNDIVKKIKKQAQKETEKTAISAQEVKNVKNLFKVNQNILWKYLQKKETY